MEKKYDVFISYWRDGGESTARILHDRLVGLGYQVFFDVESLRSGAFNTKLYSVIEECRDFIVVLSPNALDRCANEGDWVKQEIEHALKMEKNIVPVMLRNFEFPEVLPAAIEPIRYQNGIAATPEYFDAFIEKLTKFLKSKPKGKKRFLTIGIALAVAVIAILTCIQLFREDVYPGNRAEENLTQEVIYYVGNNLINYSLLAESQEDVLEAAQRYLSTSSTDISTMEGSMNVGRNAIQVLDISKSEPSESFIERLGNSPFSTADMVAMYDELIHFRQECESTLTAVEFLVSSECMLTDAQKLEALGYYQEYLDENMQAIAYFTNQMLLPITNEEALKPLWQEVLPQVRSVPLNAANWSDNYDALQNAAEECLNNMEHAVMEQYGILGNMTVQSAQEKAMLVGLYVKMGYTQVRAERIVEDIIYDYETKQQNLTKQYIQEGYTEENAKSLAEKQIRLLELQAQIRVKGSALTTDDWQTLWEKMMFLLSCDLYEEGRECMVLYLDAVRETDIYAQEYVPAVLMFIDQMEQGGIRYGAMVTATVEQGEETLLQIGDVIVAVDGAPCVSADEYLSYKEKLTQSHYSVTVLRPGDDHQLHHTELSLSKDMAPVEMYTLTES